MPSCAGKKIISPKVQKTQDNTIKKSDVDNNNTENPKHIKNEPNVQTQ